MAERTTQPPLGLVLIARNEGAALKPALGQLALALRTADVPVLVLETGAREGDTKARLARFVEIAGGAVDLVRLDETGLDHAAATALARDRLGTRYVLVIEGQDLICPAALAPLTERLAQEQPDLMLCNHGWWLAGPRSALPAGDADRLRALVAASAVADAREGEDATGGMLTSPSEARGLLADPRRLIAADAVPLGDARATDAPADWALYEAALAAAGSLSIFGDVVLLRPVPAPRLAGLFDHVAAQVRAAPGAEQAGVLTHLMVRLGDEMARGAALVETDDLSAAAARLLKQLPRRLRMVAAAQPGLAGALMAALHQGGVLAGTAKLAQLASRADQARIQALTQEVLQLRRDLDLALPGPDYLMELYERARLT